jgi:hypothetical protein
MDLNGSAMPWPGVIRANANPGLSTCVEERRICSDRLPLPVSLLEAEALQLAEWAFARGTSLVLCPPDPLAPLPALIAAAVHIADMAAYRQASGRSLGSSRHVAVVTGDYHARGVYRGLGVKHPHSYSVAPLRDVVPAATLGHDGVIRVLGADPRNGWSTIFAPSVAALSSVSDIDLIVITLPAHGVENVFDMNVPAVIVAADPSDPLLTHLDGRVPTFGWGRADIERAADHGPLTPRLAHRLSGGTCDVVAVAAHSVCENAALFWEDVGALVRSAGRSQIARDLSREAFSLFHDLSGLALPTAMYEGLSAPIRVRLEAVAAATRLTRGESRDLYLPMVEAELRDLAAALGDMPPKHEALIRTLEELVEKHGDVMLVARTAELARLHRADLAERPMLRGVRVTSLGALSEETPADAAVLTGMAPTWARSVYRSGIASTIHVLAYTPEGPVESVARGYDEVEIVRRTVALQTAREEWFARPCAKDRAWSGLTGDQRLVPDDDGHPPTGDVSTVAVREPATPDIPPGLWDGDRWLADIGPVGSEGDSSERGVPGRTGAVVVDAVRVVFDDGRWTLMDAAGTVTRLRPGSAQAEQACPVSSLKTGDMVMLFDGDSRKTLLSKVIEVAVEVPALAVAATWVAYWRRALTDAYVRFGSYRAFTDALHEQGCTVQDQTVRLWVIGVTIGPDDDEDVRRVGLVTDDPVLRDSHHEVCRAIRSLRGAHVRLGHRLSAMAAQVRSTAMASNVDEDEVVDERSGLTVADFRESVEVLTVRTIEPAGEMPYLLVGRMNEETAMDMEEDDDA